MAEGEAESKVRVNVEGAPESVNLLKAVIQVIKNLGSEAARVAETDLKKMWDTFQEGKSAGHTLEGAFKALSGSMKGTLLEVELLVIGLGLLYTAAHKTAEATLQMYKSVRQLQATAGGTLEEVQALQNAFTLMGVPAESLTIAMFRLGAAIEQNSINLRRIGIETREAGGQMREPIEVFKELRNRLSEMNSEAERNAVLRSVLGRQGARLAPIFKADAKAFEEYLARGKEIAAIDEELATQSMELLKSQGELQLEWKQLTAAFAKQIGIPVAEFFEKITTKVVHLVNSLFKLDDWLAKHGWMGQFAKIEAESKETMKHLDELKHHVEKMQGTSFLTPEEAKEKEKAEKFTHDIKSIKIKAAAEEAAEVAKITTGLAAETMQAKIAENAQLIEEENRTYAEKIAIKRREFRGMTDEKLMEQKEVLSIVREHEKKLLELELSGDKERRKLVQERLKDNEKAMERDLKQTKVVSDLQVKLIEGQEAQELAIIQTSEEDKTAAAERAERVKEEATIRSANIRMATLDRETASWIRMAAQYSDNAEIQIKANEKILESTAKRATIEIDTNKKIIADRQAMIEKLKQQEADKAGVGASLEEKALSSLKKQGFTQINSAMVKAEASRLYSWGEYYAKEYEKGGSLSAEQLEYARDWQGIARKMRDAGETGGGGVYAPVVGQIYEGGTGRMVASAERARAEAYGFRGPQNFGSVGGADIGKTVVQQTQKALEDIKQLLAGENVGGASLANTIKDMIVRALEFEAARQ